MNSGDIFRVRDQPGVYITAEVLHQLDFRGIVVIKGKSSNTVVKFRGVIASFRAEVVDEIVIFMLEFEESDYIINVVAVDAFDF